MGSSYHTNCDGGLGLRKAEALTLPAFISSRVAARSAAKLIFADMEAAGLTAPGVLMQQYDKRLEDATQRLISSNPALAEEFQRAISDGLNASARWWDLVQAGKEEDFRPRESSVMR